MYMTSLVLKQFLFFYFILLFILFYFIYLFNFAKEYNVFAVDLILPYIYIYIYITIAYVRTYIHTIMT